MNKELFKHKDKICFPDFEQKKIIRKNNKSVFNSFLSVLLTLFVLFSGINITKGQQTQNLSFNIEVPVIALVDIEPSANKNITFNLVAPTEAGLGINETTLTNSALWINYTSARLTGGPLRKVNVQITGSLPPSGIQLKLLAAARSVSCGNGTVFGSPSGQLTLSNSSQTLITGIGGYHTGDGSSCGHQLTYSLVIADYSLLYSVTSALIQISYTLSDQ